MFTAGRDFTVKRCAVDASVTLSCGACIFYACVADCCQPRFSLLYRKLLCIDVSADAQVGSVRRTTAHGGNVRGPYGLGERRGAGR